MMKKHVRMMNVWMDECEYTMNCEDKSLQCFESICDENGECDWNNQCVPLMINV
jgi:hypothetical protein